LYNRFDAAGKPLKAGDIAIVDAAEYHNYQVCVCLITPLVLNPSMRSRIAWMVRPIEQQNLKYSNPPGSACTLSNRTLVGAGLKQKSTLRRPLAELIPPHITHIPENVASFDPSHNAVRTSTGRTIAYDALVVAMGLQVNFGAIGGLSKALADPSSGVSSIYSYETCDKVWEDIDALRTGRAIFTQPQGIIKCAGGQNFTHSFRSTRL
jgi:eukaryotic sulfide quinone oxidoreductase